MLFLLSLWSLNIFGAEVEVIRLQGEAYSGKTKLNTGSTLLEGSEVRVVGDKSFIQLRFKDGSMMLQKEGTTTLRMVQPKKTLIKLLKGKIFIYKNPKADSKLNVKTRYAAMAVRGTKFYVEEGDQTYLCVCEGTVAARNKDGTVDVTAGEDLFASSKQSLEKKKAKTMMMDMASEGFTLMGIPVKRKN